MPDTLKEFGKLHLELSVGDGGHQADLVSSLDGLLGRVKVVFVGLTILKGGGGGGRGGGEGGKRG